MTPTEQVQHQKKKTPAIVTWVSLVTAFLIALGKVGLSESTGAEAIARLLGSTLGTFLGIYFVLWLTCKTLRKLTGDDNGRVAKITYVVIAILLFFAFAATESTNAVTPENADSAASLPICKSEEAGDAIQNALANLSDQTNKITMIKFIDAFEVDHVIGAEEKRNCIGRFLLNTGEGYLNFTLTSYSKDDEEFFVSVREENITSSEYNERKAALTGNQEAIKTSEVGDYLSARYWQIPNKDELEDLQQLEKMEWTMKMLVKKIGICQQAEQAEGRRFLTREDPQDVIEQHISLQRKKRDCFLNSIPSSEFQLNDEERVNATSTELAMSMSYAQIKSMNPQIVYQISAECQEGDALLKIIEDDNLKEKNKSCPEDKEWVKSRVLNTLGAH